MHYYFYRILDVQEFYRQVCASGVYNFRMQGCQHLLWDGIFLVVSLELVKHQSLSAAVGMCRFRLSSQTTLNWRPRVLKGARHFQEAWWKHRSES